MVLHSNSEPSASASDDRLDSWKEIASYLKRDERTLRRWEKSEGLPVHRHVHTRLASVYAHKSELDQWWNSRRPQLKEGHGERRWPAGALGGALLVALGLLVASVALLRHAPAPQAPPSRKLLVVLPFENLSGDSEQEYFSDGITDEIISRLGQLNPRRLGVIGRATAMQYKERNRGVQQIGEELGVDYVLEGTVRQSDERVRMTVRLLQVADQAHLWSEEYDRRLGDTLAVQDDVALAIASRIQIELTLDRETSASRRHMDARAYEDYLKGRHFFNKFSADGFHRSIEYFQKALARQPDHALSLTWMGAAHAMLANINAPPQDAYSKAKKALARALQVDPSLPEAHAEMGFCAMLYDFDWAAAEREFQTALELDPNSVLAHHGYAVFLVTQGRIEQGLAEIERARALDPLSLIINSDIGWLLFHARRYREAEAQLKKTLDLDPDFAPAHIFLGHVYSQLGHDEEAKREILWLMRSAGEEENATATLHLLETRGLEEVRRVGLRNLRQAAEKGYVPAYWLATTYLAVGETKQAMALLEKAAVERYWMMAFLKVDPRMDPLRSDPRFQKLLQEMKLEGNVESEATAPMK